MKEAESVVVGPVMSPRDKAEFLELPWRIYRHDGSWVPPIRSERFALFDRQRNPFFRAGEADFFLARRDGQVVGTIAVGADRLGNAHRRERAAFFGLFETVDDNEVARALLSTAQRWAEARGSTVLRGPSDLSSSRPGGLLVEGHETPPVILNGHTPAYYLQLVERYGFHKWGADHLAYRVDLTPLRSDPACLPPQIARVAGKAAQRSRARVRAVRLADWAHEIELAREIYNRSLEALPHFVPVSREDFARQGNALRSILDPDLVLFVEVGDRGVGFLVALPDVNQALRHASRLRYPWHYLKAWWHRRRIDCVSLKIVAVLPDFHRTGLGALLYFELAKRVLRKGYRWMDLSLTGEDNPQTNRLAAVVGAQVYKRYRVYELPLRTAGLAAST